jgi:hypothetical protein
MSISVRLSNNGFFTNFNTVLDWLAFGDEHGLEVGVDWRHDRTDGGWDFHYGEGRDNRWEAFFAPLPPPPGALPVDINWTPTLGGFRSYRLYRALETGGGGETLRRLNAAARRHVRLLPHLQRRIDDLARQFEGCTMIGAHLRNPLGSRGCYSFIPQIDVFLREIERTVRAIGPHRDWKIFAASDREGLIEAVAERYPGRVLRQPDVLRAGPDAAAEIHAAPHSSHDRGAEVIVDGWLLSRCAHLVGVQSAVGLAACVLNPELRFHCVRTAWSRRLAPLEYGVKAAWCAAFEPPSPQLAAARRMIRG